ncbi:hypothetical protein AQUCO_06100038v1 [Aquilegia coerulea]|uniref:Uncharacterized protein n=1 Tax=Aquilegia coerulea TaxID=218851 RepID=A0A2G5CD92_AQUCA|nr:hypothetical protein AQUCO_06100038v1 [Aquilegia coerulea]
MYRAAKIIVFRLAIQDNNDSCVVSLFGNLAAEMIQRDLQEILELEQIGVQLDDLFDEPKMKEFILQIKMSTYQEKMSLSITKLQVLQDNKNTIEVPEIYKMESESDNNENTIEVPEIYKMVKVKQEKNDNDLDVHFTTKNLSMEIRNCEGHSSASAIVLSPFNKSCPTRQGSDIKGKKIVHSSSPIESKGECSQ